MNVTESIYQLKDYSEKYKSNSKQEFSYKMQARSPQPIKRKFELYNSKSIEKKNNAGAFHNKPISKSPKNNMKLSSKLNSPIKVGPFEKIRLT